VDDDGFELIVRQAGREFLGSGERRQPESPFYHYAPERGLVGILETFPADT
jgi:predicted RecB family nuclease